MQTDHAALAHALKGAEPHLSARDRDFAASLLDGFRRFGRFSDRQAPYASELVSRAQRPALSRDPQVAIADLSPILAAFATARAHLKAPGFRIALNRTTALRIKIAGERSRYVGQLTLTGDGSFDDRAYFGRVDHDGRFWPGRDAQGVETEVKDALATFASDPAGAARTYARLFGKCCFCNQALTDDRSTTVGYGQTCARNYGLAYPTAAELRRAA